MYATHLDAVLSDLLSRSIMARLSLSLYAEGRGRRTTMTGVTSFSLFLPTIRHLRHSNTITEIQFHVDFTLLFDPITAGAGSRWRVNFSIKIRIPNYSVNNRTLVQIHYLVMRGEEDDNNSRHGAQLDCSSRPPSLLFFHCELTKKHDLSCVLWRGLAQRPYRSLTLELQWPSRFLQLALFVNNTQTDSKGDQHVRVS